MEFSGSIAINWIVPYLFICKCICLRLCLEYEGRQEEEEKGEGRKEGEGNSSKGVGERTVKKIRRRRMLEYKGRTDSNSLIWPNEAVCLATLLLL